MKTNEENRQIRDGTLELDCSAEARNHTLSLSGELDLANAGTLSGELERCEKDGAEAIVVDLRRLKFIDSTGIAVLVAAHRRLNGEQPRLRLIRSESSAVRRVMDVTGLDDELPFADADEEERAEV